MLRGRLGRSVAAVAREELIRADLKQWRRKMAVDFDFTDPAFDPDRLGRPFTRMPDGTVDLGGAFICPLRGLVTGDGAFLEEERAKSGLPPIR
jgi:hypothetical protein